MRLMSVRFRLRTKAQWTARTTWGTGVSRRDAIRWWSLLTSNSTKIKRRRADKACLSMSIATEAKVLPSRMKSRPKDHLWTLSRACQLLTGPQHSKIGRQLRPMWSSQGWVSRHASRKIKVPWKIETLITYHQFWIKSIAFSQNSLEGDQEW